MSTQDLNLVVVFPEYIHVYALVYILWWSNIITLNTYGYYVY